MVYRYMHTDDDVPHHIRAVADLEAGSYVGVLNGVIVNSRHRNEIIRSKYWSPNTIFLLLH